MACAATPSMPNAEAKRLSKNQHIDLREVDWIEGRDPANQVTAKAGFRTSTQPTPTTPTALF